MKELIIIAFVVIVSMIVHEVYKMDKSRRDREKALEEAAKREKRHRMRSPSGHNFWDKE